jgi:hypothetical protein
VSASRSYTVRYPVELDGKRHEAGATLALDEGVSAPLVACGAIFETPTEPKPAKGSGKGDK